MATPTKSLQCTQLCTDMWIFYCVDGQTSEMRVTWEVCTYVYLKYYFDDLHPLSSRYCYYIIWYTNAPPQALYTIVG